jgi:hypothetical protein
MEENQVYFLYINTFCTPRYVTRTSQNVFTGGKKKKKNVIVLC